MAFILLIDISSDFFSCCSKAAESVHVFYLFFSFLCLFCSHVFCLHVYVCTMAVPGTKETRRGIRAPGCVM